MRREQDAGGAIAAGMAVEFCRNLLDGLDADPVPAVTEAAGTRLGRLAIGRVRPRRLDARIVRRRPMMLTKARARGPAPSAPVKGREIIARS